MVHSVRKSMKEMGDKLAAADKERIEAAISDLETALKGDDKDAISTKTQALAEASHKLAEQMYAQAGAEAPGAGGETGGGQAAGGKEDVVDAEFEEVKEGKRKK